MSATLAINLPAFLAAAALVVLIVGLKWVSIAVLLAYGLRAVRLLDRAALESEVSADCEALLALESPEQATSVIETLKEVWGEEEQRAADASGLHGLEVDELEATLKARLRKVELNQRLQNLRRTLGMVNNKTKAGLAKKFIVRLLNKRSVPISGSTVGAIVISDETSLLLLAALAWAAWRTPATPPGIILVVAGMLLLRSVSFPQQLGRVYERIYQKERQLEKLISTLN